VDLDLRVSPAVWHQRQPTVPVDFTLDLNHDYTLQDQVNAARRLQAGVADALGGRGLQPVAMTRVRAFGDEYDKKARTTAELEARDAEQLKQHLDQQTGLLPVLLPGEPPVQVWARVAVAGQCLVRLSSTGWPAGKGEQEVAAALAEAGQGHPQLGAVLSVQRVPMKVSATRSVPAQGEFMLSLFVKRGFMVGSLRVSDPRGSWLRTIHTKPAGAQPQQRAAVAALHAQVVQERRPLGGGSRAPPPAPPPQGGGPHQPTIGQCLAAAMARGLQAAGAPPPGAAAAAGATAAAATAAAAGQAAAAGPNGGLPTAAAVDKTAAGALAVAAAPQGAAGERLAQQQQQQQQQLQQHSGVQAMEVEPPAAPTTGQGHRAAAMELDAPPAAAARAGSSDNAAQLSHRQQQQGGPAASSSSSRGPGGAPGAAGKRPRAGTPAGSAAGSRPASPIPLAANTFNLLTPENDAALAAHAAHQARLKDQQAARAAAALQEQARRQQEDQQQRQPAQRGRPEPRAQRQQPARPAAAPAAVPAGAAVAGGAGGQRLPPQVDMAALHTAAMDTCWEQQQELEQTLKTQRQQRRVKQGNPLPASTQQPRMERNLAGRWRQAMRQRVNDDLTGQPPWRVDCACRAVLASPLMDARAAAKEEPPPDPGALPYDVWFGVRLALVGWGWNPPGPDDDYQ
jgi:hypothetical protein